MAAPRDQEALTIGLATHAKPRWDAAVADAWVQITLARVSRWYDELEPDCSLDDPGWDQAEALVTAAYAVQDRHGLRQALDAYEAHARQAFDACQRRGEKESAAG